MFKKIFFYIALIVAFVACSDDVATEKENGGEVTFALRASRANTGAYVPDAASCELIKWYRVVITERNSRSIIRCIDKTLASSVEMDPMDEIKLSPGMYDVYAFANIDFDYLAGLGIKEGGSVPTDIQTKGYLVPDYFNATLNADNDYEGQLVNADAFAAAGHYIPMTGIAPQPIEVTDRVNQTFDIEVRRLFAKLEFVFSNNLAQNLQVNGLSVGEMTHNAAAGGSIRLMNYEESRDRLNLLEFTPDKAATLSHTFAAPAVIPNDGTEVSRSFYVLESLGNSVTNSFPLSFSVTPEGQSAGSVADDIRLALTDEKTITLIHRNDWIVIPVKLIDWQMRLEAVHYPPIGGYPEADIDMDNSVEFVVTFHGPGDFELRPFVRKYFGSAEWFGVNDPTKVVGAPVITFEDPDHLLAKVPVFSKSGEIICRMNLKPGKQAILTVALDVKQSEEPLVTRTIKRKIYITQK